MKMYLRIFSVLFFAVIALSGQASYSMFNVGFWAKKVAEVVFQDVWTATANVGAPSIRMYNSSVWTGSQMIIWGGRDSIVFGNHLQTGNLYNPESNTWSIMTTVGAPTGRAQHTAIWTGSKMIVWGGSQSAYDSHISFNTGGIYDPSTNTWASMSTAGAPAGRSGHTAIWTGSKMIVWGGFGGTYVLVNTGGVYDPVTNTWASMSLMNAPSARQSHIAIWTGSRMIIWGGAEGSGGYSNTGNVYDPATNTWTSLSSAGAPSARAYHTAIWTGTQMIVWGGQDAASGLNSGGSYSPSTNTWIPLSVTGAPAARYAHTALWTGSRMIIWGGSTWTYGSNVSYLNSGGSYNPATNSWTTMTVTGAPSERHAHAAIWTGSKMVVWGGVSSASLLNTGGVYQ